MEEQMKMMMAGFQKTRNGVIKKVITPSSSGPLGAEVKSPTEEIAHLIDVSVASKYGSDMSNTARTITEAVATRLEEFKVQLNKDLENNLFRHAHPVVHNNENPGKQPMQSENGMLTTFPSYVHTPSAS